MFATWQAGWAGSGDTISYAQAAERLTLVQLPFKYKAYWLRRSKVSLFFKVWTTTTMSTTPTCHELQSALAWCPRTKKTKALFCQIWLSFLKMQRASDFCRKIPEINHKILRGLGYAITIKEKRLATPWY